MALSSVTTVVMVWSFLGQVLRDGKEASCQAAVARVIGVSFFTRSEQQSVIIRQAEHGFVVVILSGRLVGGEAGGPFLVE